VVRLRRIEDCDRIFFVTTDLARNVVALSPAECDLVLEALAVHHCPGNFLLLAYVVMPDHMHLLLAPQEQTLPQILRDLKSKSGHEIARRRSVPGPIWQPRYFDNIIRRVRHFWEKLDYIHQNPVEAALVGQPHEWKWSSYRFYARLGRVPIVPDPVDLPSDANALLWPAPWR